MREPKLARPGRLLVVPPAPAAPPAFSGTSAALAAIQSGLQFLAAADSASLPDAELADCLKGLQQAAAAQTAARARILGAFHARGVFEDDGARSARSWLVWQTRTTRAAAAMSIAWMRRLAVHPRIAAALSAVLDSLGKKAGPEDSRTRAQRDHDALEEACRRLMASGIPDSAGQPAQILLHMTLSQLRDLVRAGPGTGGHDTGGGLPARLTAPAVGTLGRRMAPARARTPATGSRSLTSSRLPLLTCYRAPAA
jgi:Domain of unknown function (DUF222)